MANKIWKPSLDTFRFGNAKTNSQTLKNIKYLSLEGGGGKGNVYVGALIVLEDLKIIPVKPDEEGKKQIKGIAGTSSGAITCLLLALGCNAKQIIKLTTKPNKDDESEEDNDLKGIDFYDFNNFFEQPMPGVYKGVTYIPERKANFPVYYRHHHMKTNSLLSLKKNTIKNEELLNFIKNNAKKQNYEEFTWIHEIGSDQKYSEKLDEAFFKAQPERYLFKLAIGAAIAKEIKFSLPIILRFVPTGLKNLLSTQFFRDLINSTLGVITLVGKSIKNKKLPSLSEATSAMWKSFINAYNFYLVVDFVRRKAILPIIDSFGDREVDSIKVLRNQALNHIVDSGMSILVDRGLFTGINVRRFMVKQMAFFIPRNFPDSSFNADVERYNQIYNIDSLIKKQNDELSTPDGSKKSQGSNEIDYFLYDNYERKEHYYNYPKN